MNYDNNIVNNNNNSMEGVVIPFDDNETSYEQECKVLMGKNAVLQDVIKNLKLSVDHLERVTKDTQLQLHNSKKETKEFKSRYISSLAAPLKFILNDEQFWFVKEYSDILFHKYMNKEKEGGALLKFNYGDESINETNQKIYSFIHKFSFGEIVIIECGTELNVNGHFEGIVVFESKNNIEYLTNENNRLVKDKLFTKIEKESVFSLDRRVVAIEFIHIFRMSFLRTKNQFQDIVEFGLHDAGRKID